MPSNTDTVEIEGITFTAVDVPDSARAKNIPIPRAALAAMDQLGADSVLVESGARSTKGNDLNAIARRFGLPVKFTTRRHVTDEETGRKTCDLYAERVAQVVETALED